MERDLVDVDGLLTGLAASCPALEQRLQDEYGLFEGEAVGGAKVAGGARG